MGKYTNPLALDAALDYIAASDRLIICAGQPASYAEANANLGTGAGKRLGEIALDAGDFTKANGTVTGSRKLTIAAQTAIDALVDGTGDHIALVHTATSTLRLVTTCPATAIDDAQAYNTAAFEHEIGAVA